MDNDGICFPRKLLTSPDHLYPVVVGLLLKSGGHLIVCKEILCLCVPVETQIRNTE